MYISQSQATERWNVLPERLREALFSEFIAESVLEICKNHHLIDEKAAIVKTYAAYVLMGFLHPEEFVGEIQLALSLPAEVAKQLGEGVEKKIFSEYTDDIQKVYAPASSEKEAGIEVGEEARGVVSDTGEKKTITFAGLAAEAPKQEEQLPITVSEKAPTGTTKTEENPFVLQEERPVAETVQPSFKKFSFSLGGFFGSKKKEEKASEEPVRAKIELFGDKKEGKEKRVVHYSELRTPLGESVFNVSPEEQKTIEPTPAAAPAPQETAGEVVPAKKAPWSFKWFGTQSPARDEQKDVPVHKTIDAAPEEGRGETPSNSAQQQEKKETPHIEGNTIDLRK